MHEISTYPPVHFPGTTSLNARLLTRQGSAAYAEAATMSFTPNATVTHAIDEQMSVLTIGNGQDVDAVKLNTYAYLDDEVVAVRAIDLTAMTVTVDRGVLDTVPVPHLAAARLWFADAVEALVTGQYLSGESVQVKMTPATGLGRLAESAAPADSYTFAARMNRPYVPGNVRVNSLMWPSVIVGQIVLTWAHRNRLQQTAYLVTQSEGNIGPEAGVTYTVRIYNENNALQKTVTGLATVSWAYPAVDEAIDSGLHRINGKVRIEIEAVRASLPSWQKQSRSFDRAGYGLNYGKYYGGI